MDEDFSLDELKLAFSYHVVNQILGADGSVVPAEARFLEKTFPRLLLERSGFVDAKGAFTKRWHDALGEALLQLPTRSVPERVAIVDTFFRAALADEALEVAEAGIMKRAARLLGLQEEDYDQIVDQLVTSEVDLESIGDDE